MAETKETAPAGGVVTNSSYEDLLQEVIRKHSSNPDTTVRVKHLENVVPVGNNFHSCLHRVFIEISRNDQPVEERAFIVKDFPKVPMIQAIVKEGRIFENEITTYSKILPEMKRVGSAVLGSSSFGPDSFDTGMNTLLVLQDLKQAGYKMPDKHAGLDFDHCKMAIIAIARFHGISLALVDADKSFFDILPGAIFHKEMVEKSDMFIRPMYQQLSKTVEAWPGFERFGDKLRHAAEILSEKLIQLNDPKNTEMAVLNHGDFWLNNLLFKYSETGEVEDIRFVDFQMTRFASPAIDLNYFLVASPNDDVRDRGIDTLVEVYHSELCRVLEALGCGDKIVTLDWLKEELKEKMFFGLHVACTILSLIKAEPDTIPDFLEPDSFDLSNLEGQKDVIQNFHKGAKYSDVLQKLLLKFEKEGVL